MKIDTTADTLELSDDGEYERWRELEGVELEDTVTWWTSLGHGDLELE